MPAAIRAITHVPSPAMERCELTHVQREPMDYNLALRQHAAYCDMLRDCGVSVMTLDVNRALPDCVFVEDTAIVLDEGAVLCRPGAASRRAEPAGIEPELRKYRAVYAIEAPGTLDGGDVVHVGNTLLVGRSLRTNNEGIAGLASIVRRWGYTVKPIEIHGCLHLKSACTPLPDGSLLVNPQWVDRHQLTDFELVDIPEQESWAADVLSIGENVCVAAQHVLTAELIRSRGFNVHCTDLSEFAKAEGGVTCLSLLIHLR